MTSEFEDSDTLLVPADFLDLIDSRQLIKTSKRLIPGCNNLYWWIQCYLNGDIDANKGHVGVFVNTSIGGFEKSMTVTILRSDIKCTDTDFYEEAATDGWGKLASHATIKSGDIIKNGIFVVKCEVIFKMQKDRILRKVESFEDSKVVKFDRKLIETYKFGQKIVEDKQTIDGITWWIEYYPCFITEDIGVYFHIDIEGPIRMNFSCAMSINSVFIQKSTYYYYDTSGSGGFAQCFSHKQCLLADTKNGIINLVFNLSFERTTTPTPLPVEIKPTKLSIKDSITVTMVEYQLDHNDIGEFDSSPKTFVKGSDKHEWRLQWFPAGDCTRAKDHISLFVEASTTEKKTVTLSGVIKIVGTTFEKTFNMIVENESSSAFQKLISHEELRRIGGITNGTVTIVCEGTFHTFNDLKLN